MSNKENEEKDILSDDMKMIASRYAEIDGERLRKEMEEIESISDLRLPLESLDKRVKINTRPANRRRYAGYIGLVAVIIAALFIPRAVELFRGGLGQSSGMTSSPSESPSKLIALSFDLPERFSVAEVEQDVGKTVYHIDDELNDDVVMIVEKADEEDGGGLKKVYTVIDNSYNLITFSKDGLTYTLTCQFDIETIEEIANKII